MVWLFGTCPEGDRILPLAFQQLHYVIFFLVMQDGDQGTQSNRELIASQAPSKGCSGCFFFAHSLIKI